MKVKEYQKTAAEIVDLKDTVLVFNRSYLVLESLATFAKSPLFG